MTDFQSSDAYLDRHLDESLDELGRFVAQPSISAQNIGLDEAAGLVAKMLQARGFHVDIYPTAGAPIVVGERKGESNKTLLFYNHYDVQPPEPLELWDSPPFIPQIREGKMFGRGISDDKGHLVARLFALDALLAEGELPCTVKFIVEGEEEAASTNLVKFVTDHTDLLQADACVWEFGGVDHMDTPMQYLGLRGIQYVELSVDLLKSDVHSGLGGSIFPNAAWRLVWALNTLKNSDEHILIPGFYDNVKPPSTRDRELMSLLADVAEEYKTRYGLPYFIKGLVGEDDIKVEEVFSPTCTICGLTSGYQGPGSKTILPASASAKIDFRLVPDQDPSDILGKLRTHLDNQGFTDVKIKDLGGDAPARTDPDHPFIKTVVDTSRDVYGKPMTLVPMVGGSGPSYPFVHKLGLPVATAGMGYPDTQTHAPNENIRIDLYLKHAKHMLRVIREFSK
jgi:acetylornithine deacetylase/succinyl-diaminopimelate desuccinylase-like protein